MIAPPASTIEGMPRRNEASVSVSSFLSRCFIGRRYNTRFLERSGESLIGAPGCERERALTLEDRNLTVGTPEATDRELRRA